MACVDCPGQTLQIDLKSKDIGELIMHLQAKGHVQNVERRVKEASTPATENKQVEGSVKSRTSERDIQNPHNEQPKQALRNCPGTGTLAETIDESAARIISPIASSVGTIPHQSQDVDIEDPERHPTRSLTAKVVVPIFKEYRC